MLTSLASLSRRLLVLVPALALAACTPARGTETPAAPVAVAPPADPAPVVDSAPATPPAPATPLADGYRDVAASILAAARTDDGAWQKLSHLTDRIGARPSGSKALEQAVAWATATMQADGHDNVRAEAVMVPHWLRGSESGAIMTPIERPLHLLALGGSGGTGKAGVTGEVVVVDSFDQLDALGDQLKGKIVLFNHPMAAYDQATGLGGYGEAVPYRTEGPVRAAEHGAVAALVRSVTSRSLGAPHTGLTDFGDKQKPIPAVAVTVEDAELLARLAASGDKVTVKLQLGARRLPDAPSANVVGELTGREHPEEIVIISAHLDSWDVGQGAHDDGAGVAAVMQALTLLRQLDLRPRRTIRVVLWTNEESGLRGAFGYAKAHEQELEHHVFAVEMDEGGFAPTAFSVKGSDVAVSQLGDIVSLLAPLGDITTHAGFAGADIIPLGRAGVIGAGLEVAGEHYFDYHHSEADTLDKVDPAALAQDVAALAVVAYVVADMPEHLGGVPSAAAAPAAAGQ